MAEVSGRQLRFFYDDPDGGTLARVLSNECMMTLTAQRAQELEAMAQP